MKNKVLSFAIALIALFAFNTAQAQNAHFTDVMVSEDGLTVTGKIAGLGNKYTGQKITITYNANAIGTSECLNPGNGGVVPGQSGATSSLKASEEIKITAKNGNVTFELTLDASTVVVEDCKGKGLIQGPNHGVVTSGAKTLTFEVGGATGSITL